MVDGSPATEIGQRFWARARALTERARARPVTTAALATAAVSVVAVAVPGLDLWVAGLFHGAGGGFPASRMPALIELRLAGMAVTRIVVALLVLALLGKLFVPMLMRGVSSRKVLFLATSLALGPGLLVNAILKEFWGRPRPWQVTDFGGTMDFFPAWVPGGACPSNCSFPSGEASSAMWLIALAFVVPPAWRRATLALAVAWALVISLNRMAFGGHFFFDVLIAWGLMVTVVLALRTVILERIGPTTEARIDDGLARAGERLLAAMRAPAAWLDRRDGASRG